MKKTLLAIAVAASLAAPLAMAADAVVTPKPIAALLSTKAQHNLLLGVTKVGADYLAVGGNGVILRSTNGEQWTQIPSPVDTALTQLVFADAKHGWAVGHDGAILRSVDGGATWTLQSWQPELNAPLFGISALDADNAVAVGAFSTLKRTVNGGAEWSDVEAPDITADKGHFNAITRLRDGRLLLVGERGLVGLSTDGMQWQRVATPYEGSFFGALPIGEHGVLVFGMRGNLYYAEQAESGLWVKINSGTTTSFFGGTSLNANEVALVGADGVILRVNVPLGTTQSVDAKGIDRDQLLASAYVDAGKLIVCGEKGVGRVTLSGFTVLK